MRVCEAALLTMAFAMIAATGRGENIRASDWQVWSEADIVAEISSRVNLTVPMVVRNSFELPNPQLAGLGPVFDFALTNLVTVTGGYLFVILPQTGSGYNVHVPLAAITLNESWRRFRFSDRNRAEKLIGLPGAPIRYRNKFVIERSLASGRWIPFVKDEAFYDFSQSSWTQNRLEAGTGIRLNPLLHLEAYYLERSARKSHPNSVHALGLTLEIYVRTLKRSHL